MGVGGKAPDRTFSADTGQSGVQAGDFGFGAGEAVAVFLHDFGAGAGDEILVGEFFFEFLGIGAGAVPVTGEAGAFCCEVYDFGKGEDEGGFVDDRLG
jgi:hypothetical protein